MTGHEDLERRLARWFEAEALGPAPAGRFEQAIEVTRTRRPRLGLLAGFGSAWVETGRMAAPRLSWRTVGIIALLVLLALALAAGAIFVGGQQRRLPGVVLPAGSGLIAYDSGGDIYVGDPATGETKAIVTGQAIDSSPIFSPDGTLIAFTRGDVIDDGANDGCRPATTPCQTSVVVVRADGSDEQVIAPAGFLEHGLGGFSWTPDSGSLIVNHDMRGGPLGGDLSLFDASGVAEPRPLTPPFPRWPGAFHPQIGAEIAPMFRPPLGDRILSYPGPEDPDAGTARLVEMDLDGSNVTELIGRARADVPFDVLIDPRWSRDAASVAFTAGAPECPLWACIDWDENWRGFVMSADASHIRRLTREAEIEPGDGMVEQVIGWSPDGSKVLVVRQTVDDVASLPQRPSVAVTWSFAAVNVTSGVEYEVGKPYTITVRYDPYPRSFSDTPIPEASWSPDSLAVLIWEGPGSRSIVIDAETGVSRTLPWATDSHPSWRRTATTNPD